MSFISLDKVKNPQMREQLESAYQKVMGLTPIVGNVYYVCSVTGSDNSSGQDITMPKASIDSAIGMCTASKGDIIFVLPGHSESYTTTGTKLTGDVVGITIIGIGEGSNRPTISFGHTGTTTVISSANITIANILFVTAVDSVVTFMTISGNDCTLMNCEFRDATDKEVITDITVTGDRFKAIGCFKNGFVTGDANVRVFGLNGVDNAIIEDCVFMTKVTTAIVNLVTTACTNIIVRNCVFYVNGTSNFSKNGVDTITGSTWMMYNCYDLSAGNGFSGGSGAALASDDVSSVNTAIAALQTDLGNPSARTNLQNIEAMLGNPDVAAQSIWDALCGAGGIATYPAGASAANNVSLAEVIKFIQDNIINGAGTALPADQSIYDLLAGTNGIATFPASLPAANNVSLAEVIRYIQDQVDKIETPSNAVKRLAGKTQIFTANITAAANAGVTTLGTITTQSCMIKRIVLISNGATTADLTSAAIKGGASQAVVFIAAGTAVKASIDAEDEQVAFSGAGVLNATDTIVVDLQGTGATAVNLTAIVEYCAVVDGGYIV